MEISGLLRVTALHMLEREITAAIMRHLKTVPHCFAWKEHGGMYGTAGLPDIICCHRGRFVAFEVKAPNGRLTKLQEITIQKIQKAKGLAFKVTSVEEVKEIIKNLDLLIIDEISMVRCDILDAISKILCIYRQS